MGTWSVDNLYDNDLASDIETEVKSVFSQIEVTAGIERIFQYYQTIIEPDEEYIIWLVIGDVLWRHGSLNDELKVRVLKSIEFAESKNTDFVYSKDFICDYKKRISSIQPRKRKLSKPITCRSIWKEGDVIAYKLLNEKFLPNELKMLKNKSVLIRVVSLWKLPVSRIIPDTLYNEFTTVMLYNWIGEESDISMVDFKQLDYLPIRVQKRTNSPDTIYMKGGMGNSPYGAIKWDIKPITNIGSYCGDLNEYENGGDIVSIEHVLINLIRNDYTFSPETNTFIRSFY